MFGINFGKETCVIFVIDESGNMIHPQNSIDERHGVSTNLSDYFLNQGVKLPSRESKKLEKIECTKENIDAYKKTKEYRNLAEKHRAERENRGLGNLASTNSCPAPCSCEYNGPSDYQGPVPLNDGY